MDAIIEAKVMDYLWNNHYCKYYDTGTVLEAMRSLARMSGRDLNESFRFAGMGAGPEARIASGIVDLALGGGGCDTSEYAIRMHIRDWLHRQPRKGRL
jgi:hypothetical protein